MAHYSDDSFDYYEELQIEKTASQDEVKTAFRRLALKTHPDKNRGDQDAAKTAFQRLQASYETLSDPVKRQAYDSGSSLPSAFGGDPGWSDEFHNTPGPYNFWGPDSDSYFSQGFFSANEMFEAIFRAWTEQKKRNGELQRTEKEKRERERQEETRRHKEEEARRRREDEELRKLREHKKQAQAENEASDKQRRLAEEKKRQEDRWSKGVPASETLRTATCLHSDFCAKEQKKKKVKCATCGVKRGMTAFKCPYCATLLCQLCVVDFRKARAKLEALEGGQVPGVEEAEIPGEAIAASTASATAHAPKATATAADPTAASTTTAYVPKATAMNPTAARSAPESNHSEMMASETTISETANATTTRGTPSVIRQGKKKAFRDHGRSVKKPSAFRPDPAEPPIATTTIAHATKATATATNPTAAQAITERRTYNILTPEAMTPKVMKPKTTMPETVNVGKPSTTRQGETKTKPLSRDHHKPVKNPSASGPDPGYDGRHHRRCGNLHAGGDAKCYVVHPDRRPSRPSPPA